MSISEKNVERRRGNTYPHTIYLNDKNGIPIPLTTETFALGVDSSNAPVGIPNILNGVVGVIIDAATAQIDFPMDGTVAVGNYFYDIDMIDTNGKNRTIVHGKWDVIQDIEK